jgi:hypothetical protein
MPLSVVYVCGVGVCGSQIQFASMLVCTRTLPNEY